MPKFTKEQVGAMIAGARTLSLAFIGVEAEPVKVEEDTPEVKRAKLIGQSIRKMSNLCKGAKLDVAQLMSTVLDLEIKPGYHGGSSSSSSSSFTADDYAIIVPTESERGFAVGKPIVVLSDGSYCMRGSGKVSERTCGWRSMRDSDYRKATEVEINQFYDLLLAHTNITLTFSPKFNPPVPAE